MNKMATSEPILPNVPNVKDIADRLSSTSSSASDDPRLAAAELLEDLNTICEPSPLDRRIYLAHRAGKTIRQLARSQQMTLDQIHQAIFRVELDNERYSSLATGVETRKIYLKQIERIDAALAGALTATKMVGKKTVMIDKESGDIQTVEETVERPDYDTQLRAIDSTRFLVAVVQPKDPAVVVNTTTNTQNNVLNAPGMGAGGTGGMTSPEAVIRAIVAERQKALPQPAAPTMTIPQTAATTTLEGVPAMARDPEQPDGEYEEVEEPEDGDEDEEDEEYDEDEDGEGEEDD
ncbi:MAG: hypothetical protein KGL39_40420 [Patescibacteria group bacterium]|nr:hypothetical protein [Patescibacteria group bacterium]